MRRIAWAVVCALIVAVPALRSNEKPPPAPQLPPVAPPLHDTTSEGDKNYKAPQADAAVVELLDENLDALVPVLNNDNNNESGTASREDRDIFAGVEAMRITPQQKYRENIPGWNYKIVEKPQNAGEFRYVRFAWKKNGGQCVMIQFHRRGGEWGYRYYAGRNVFNWNPSIQISATLPKDWEVVTRDMFKDFGELPISGMALTPMDENFALFDHILLGRTIEDLDKATDVAFGKVKPTTALKGKERETRWAELMGTDRVKAAAAQREFLASAADHIDFIREQLTKSASDRERELFVRAQKYLNDLDADDFDTRDRATEELVKLGDLGAEAAKTLAEKAPNDEVQYRANIILRRIKTNSKTVSSTGRTTRAIRVLERAGTADAKALLQKIADGGYGFDIALEAKAALVRLKTGP